MSLLFNILSSLVIAFLPRNKHLLISWLHLPSAVILVPNKIKALIVYIVSPSIWPLPICLDSRTLHSRFLCSIALYSIGLYFITSHIHNWMLFLFRLHLFILSGVISPLISHSILGTYRPGEFIFQCPLSFCLFILFMGFSKQEYWSSLPFPSPVDHILSELCTMTRLSWVVLYGMAHSFIELDKAVVHVIWLVSFLWLWFSFCLPSDVEG